jgi:D-serine deaminase-like pyridoxal phosphate-dependent protein
MAKGASAPTRVMADIAATAASVASAENRTATEQINYWARIGMQIERSGSVTSRRVLAVAAGEAQFAGLVPEERSAAHAVIDARLAEQAAKERFGPAARAAGHTTVSIDDDGALIEIAPDGSRRRL